MKTNWIKRIRSTKGIFAILFLLYIVYGAKRCHEENDVVKLEFNEFNPPIYDFPFSEDSITNTILDFNSQYGYMRVSERKENVFKLERYCYFPGSYLYVYRRKKNQSIHLSYNLIVRLDSLSPDSTRVIVREINTSVQYGVKLWKGPTFENYWYKQNAVASSGIREYEFLRVLGKKLGYLDKMPFTKYPKALSQQMILYRFGRKELFSVDEVFEYPEEGLQEWYEKSYWD